MVVQDEQKLLRAAEREDGDEAAAAARDDLVDLRAEELLRVRVRVRARARARVKVYTSHLPTLGQVCKQAGQVPWVQTGGTRQVGR